LPALSSDLIFEIRGTEHQPPISRIAQFGYLILINDLIKQSTIRPQAPIFVTAQRQIDIVRLYKGGFDSTRIPLVTGPAKFDRMFYQAGSDGI